MKLVIITDKFKIIQKCQNWILKIVRKLQKEYSKNLVAYKKRGWKVYHFSLVEFSLHEKSHNDMTHVGMKLSAYIDLSRI